MRRSFVVVTITSTVAFVACSDATNPVAAPRLVVAAQAVGDIMPPLAPGVRVDTVLVPNSQYRVLGLNNLGEISGTFQPDTGASRAFRGFPGHLQFLANSGAGPLNDEGDALISLPGNISGVWERSGQIVPLAEIFPDSTLTCSAEGINDLRQTAGLCIVFSDGGGINSVIVEWSRDGKPRVLSANGVALSNGEALSINQLGQVAGFDFDLTPSQAFVLSPNHQVRILPSITGGQAAVAWRVNERQWVAGQSSDPACGGNRAVAWSPSDSVVNLGVCGQAFWINDGNIAIGKAEQSSLADDFAFVWTPTIGLRRLPPVQQASGTIEVDQPIIINERNQIIGTAQIEDSNGNIIRTMNAMWTLPLGYGR